jgi:hypothetical protein
MKKMKSRLAVILAMMMIFTSFEFVGVFAEDEVAPEQVATEQVATPAAAEEASGETSSEPAQTIANVGGVSAYASYDRVVFMWSPVEGADGYIITTSTGIKDAKVPAAQLRKDGDKLRYDVVCGEGRPASISVKAYKAGPEGDIVSASASGNGTWAVETIRYRVRIKKSGTLKAHGGNGPRSIYVRKGQYIDCYGFGGGKYIFNYGGSIFYCNKSRTNRRSCVFNGGKTYSAKEAELFVNDRGLSSGTGVLVWINTYTQTLYKFRGSAGNWHCDLISKCSTGKAASPTPTGVSGVKTVWKKISKRHGIRYWTAFSQINSIHGKKAKWGMGAPRSNGCVRNYVNAAYDVYYGAPIGTTVYVF